MFPFRCRICVLEWVERYIQRWNQKGRRIIYIDDHDNHNNNSSSSNTKVKENNLFLLLHVFVPMERGGRLQSHLIWMFATNLSICTEVCLVSFSLSLHISFLCCTAVFIGRKEEFRFEIMGCVHRYFDVNEYECTWSIFRLTKIIGISKMNCMAKWEIHLVVIL